MVAALDKKLDKKTELNFDSKTFYSGGSSKLYPSVLISNPKMKVKDFDSVVLSIPNRNIIEIVFSPFKNDFVFFYKNKKNEPSNIGLMLSSTYKKLVKPVTTFSNQEIHFYGFIDNNEFLGVDIYINSNWLDHDLSESLYKECDIKTLNTVYKGQSKLFKIKKGDLLLMKQEYEFPDRTCSYFIDTI